MKNLGEKLTDEELEKKKQETLKKWDSLGFLDGLKGLVDDETSKLFESKPSQDNKEIDK